MAGRTVKTKWLCPRRIKWVLLPTTVPTTVPDNRLSFIAIGLAGCGYVFRGIWREREG
jgi:hypothetical protein